MANTGETGALTVELAETLDISTVQSLHGELKAALGNGAPLSVDGSRVSRVDTAALQVLTAMFMEAESLQYKLKLDSPSDALVEGAALLGVSEHIGLKSSSN